MEKYLQSGWREKLLHCLMTLIFIGIAWLSWKSFLVEEEDSDYFEDHTNVYALLCIVRVTCYLARLPHSIELFLGFFLYNLFSTERKTQNGCNKEKTQNGCNKEKTQNGCNKETTQNGCNKETTQNGCNKKTTQNGCNKETSIYTLSFRVVTKGLFPDLVRSTLKRNMEMVEHVGLNNYVFEVVTNNRIGLNQSERVREIVVPTNYVTPKGTLYKARSLQYCLEPRINRLNDNDWVIHLDEETLLTKGMVHGIMQFTRQNKYQFGQAVTTFADEEIINWITTFGDIHRVGADYGHLRNCLGCLNITFGNWKGNFFISRLADEREISFDFGPKGSITEDCTFGMVAASKGYKFGFVSGETWEKSPFTVGDFIRQRKRWIKGVILGLTLTEIPFRHKIGMIMMSIGWMTKLLLIPDIILAFIYPIKFPFYILGLMSFSKSVSIFTVLLGAIKSFSVKRFGYIKVFILCVLSVLLIPVIAFLESCGIIAGFLSLNSNDFYIIDKDQSKYLNKKKIS